MAIQQADRTVMIATPLEENELVIRSFTATERLGRPFQVEAELLSGNFEIKFEDLLGQNVTIRLDTASGTPRFFNGFVSRFSQGAPFGRLARYHATIVPWLWFLTRTSDCRIFQTMAVPDIIKQVLRDRGFNDFEDALTGSYRTWEYCVQYRETDFNFVNRLMEQEGIYYFFVHEDGKHRLVLADGPDSHSALEGSPTIPFRRSDRGSVVDDRECVDDWSVSKELQPGNYSLESFDFKVPAKELRTAAAIIRDHAGSGFEMFDYPNDYVEPADGEKYAMMREQELQAQYEVAQAHGDCRDVCAGFTFALTEFPREDQNREYLITSAQYHVTSDAFDVGGGGGRGGSRPFACSFTALEAKTQFRPPRITPKPIIQGPQTAIIVGPAGQEIHLDEFGRVKVQFHWDRHGQYDENSSCWVRVSQGWAGKQWGIVFNPRIGQEVIVDFLEGDPDQPIITGRVYNGANMPPYAVPANGTHSGIKSRSSKGGTPNNFNEIRMEDTKGSELFYLQAEKDWKIHVKKNETENVGGSISTSAGGAISRSSGGSHSRTAGDSITDKATNTYTLNTGKGQSLKAGGSYQLLTNEGIHLKTINFVMELIEAGIEGAMAALKGDAGAAVEAAQDYRKTGGTGKAEALGSKIAGQMSTAFGPAIGAASGELTRMCSGAEEGMAKSVGPKAEAAGEAAAKFTQAVQGEAGAEAIATAFVGMAVAAYEAYADAKKLIDGLLPKIPSIVMWAMKDIQGQALWNVSFESKFRDISLETKTRDIHVKGKKNVNVEATKKDLNLKASAKDVNMTAKKKMSIKTEEDNLVIDCGKNMTVKVKKKLQLKCGDASITLLDGGEILIRGKEIKINATSGATTVLGTPIKLN